jgi:hypothetical protein
MLHEGEGKKTNTGRYSRSQGMLKIASKPPKAKKETWNKFSLPVPGRN